MTAVLLNVVSGANIIKNGKLHMYLLTKQPMPKTVYLFHVNLDTCTYVLDTCVKYLLNKYVCT